jgi:predicted aconitase
VHLTQEQKALLDGQKGEAMAKVMKTLVMYGQTFGADRMVPVTSENGHLVTSFGLSVMKPVYSLMQELIDAGVVSSQPFSVDPRPLDQHVPANLLQSIVFKVMYGKQERYEKQLKAMGLMSETAFTCTCYMDEIGNTPKKGDVLSWAESSAVVYANSVLGARCNRNSGIIEMFGSIAGFVPYFGLLTDEGRKASWVVEVKTSKRPEAQVLGSAIGMKVVEAVPYIKGLDRFLGARLDGQAKDYLKDMGAATASNGAVGLYHVEGLTPDAVDLKDALIKPDAKTYVIDDAELERVKAGYPCVWEIPRLNRSYASSLSASFVQTASGLDQTVVRSPQGQRT